MDIGAATIAAFNAKDDLSSITEADLDKVADYIEGEYPRDPLKSFLGVAFTTNAWFNQPAFDKQPEKRAEYSRRLLRGYRENTPKSAERCVFTGRPALDISFSDKLPPGRAFRQHIPLLTGEGAINFFPWGNAGLPVSGEAIICIQAFPLGCAKCGGKLLAVYSDNPELIYEFAREFLIQNQKSIILAQQSGSRKMPESQMSAKTLLIDTLLKIDQARRDESSLNGPCSVTAYHLSNSGQSNPLDARNPPLEIYYLPLELTDFLSSLAGPDYRDAWSAIVKRAWWVSQGKKKKGKNDEEENSRPRRNVLYEDLLRLPLGAREFVRHYFLRIPRRTKINDDPRRNYSLKDETELVSWKLTELFLKKVMVMKKEQIEQIRELGDRLASYISSENDRRFFTSFYADSNTYDKLRNTLIKANDKCIKHGGAPLITFEPYLTVFEDGDEIGRSDWRLIRDLVLIRMVESLYKSGWIGKNSDVIPQDTEEEKNEN